MTNIHYDNVHESQSHTFRIYNHQDVYLLTIFFYQYVLMLHRKYSIFLSKNSDFFVINLIISLWFSLAIYVILLISRVDPCLSNCKVFLLNETKQLYEAIMLSALNLLYTFKITLASPLSHIASQTVCNGNPLSIELISTYTMFS